MTATLLIEFLEHWALDFLRAAGLYVAAALLMLAARRWLGSALVRMTLGRSDVVGVSAGAVLGMLTPVCSCGVAPMYLSLIEGGASRQAAAAFLFAAPALNEIALALVLVAWGWKGALLYLAAGLGAALLTGLLAGRLGLGRIDGAAARLSRGAASGWRGEALAAVRRMRGFAWALAAGTALSAWFHVTPVRSWAWFLDWAHHPLAPLGAVAVGLPLDLGAAAAAPLVLPLAGRGLPMGTLLSLLMALTVASLPEGLVLSRMIGWRRVSIYGLWLAAYIAGMGLLFNLLPAWRP